MDGIAWAASAMAAARTRLDVATHNLANVSSGGFRGSQARGFLTALGVRIAVVPSPLRGSPVRTGRGLDVAIVGDGAFLVRDGEGRVAQTRDGAFVRQADGTLQDERGRTLLGARGPVRFPEGASFEPDGAIRAGGREIARVALPPGSTLRAGYLESSGVDAIAEMIDVTTAQRSFESAQKVVSAIDGARQKAANDVARVR
ncbi:MAG TPA: flagellar basal body rod C-terminal domain-containing protein [Verrucomicrobiae bacterium]|nr:flagellar basal body rod C-terminal domain-containing protein [Verrucomicrobiae bacterium]